VASFFECNHFGAPAMRRTAIPASPLQRHGAGCSSILMTKRLRALLLTAHAE